MKKNFTLAACLFFLMAASSAHSQTAAKPQKENPLRVLWQFDTEG